MADDTSDLLAQAQAIQAKALQKQSAFNSAASPDLLAQAKMVQQARMGQAPASRAPSQNFSTAQSAGIAAEKGLTGGLTGVAAGLGAGLGSLSGGGDFMPAYREGLNERKAYEDAAHAAHPIVSTVSDIAGSIPSTMVGAGALKAAGVASPLAQGAALGGGTGLTNYLGQNADPSLSGAAESTAIGAGLGLAGAKAGEMVGNALNPENLEVAGSKMASRAIGMKPSKELTTAFNEDTGRMESGSNIIKGVGKTLMDQGALPATGGADAIYDATLQAINRNYEQLAPIYQQTQAKLTPVLSDVMDDVRPVTLKTADLMQQMSDQIPDTSGKLNLMQKLGGVYQTYAQKLDQADGNLAALNEIKRELQSAATDLSKNVYNQGSDASWEATLLKRMGGVVRQHIEDLANGTDQGAGDQIHELNNNIGLLQSALPYIKKLGDKPSTSVGAYDLRASSLGFLFGGPMGAVATEGTKLGTELVTGNPVGRLAKMGAAKMLNAASDIETPLGTLVQNAPKPVIQGATISPWSQEKAENKAGVNVRNANPDHDVTRTAAGLYNATNESLRNVAQKLKSQAGMSYTGDYLQNAIDNNDQDAKNRAIFLIMQSPQARALVTPEK